MNWQPANTAPKTGEHILVSMFGKGGFGYCGGKRQDWCAVVHYWDNAGEEGFYLSTGAMGPEDRPMDFTHWQTLEAAGSTGAPPLDQPTPAAEIDELCEAVAALAQPAGPTEDTLRLDALHREGHSLMVYGNGLWDAGWGVMPTPRDAIDAMRRDYCNVIMRESEEGVDRCKRPAEHTGEHWMFPDDLPPLPAVASVRSAPAPEVRHVCWASGFMVGPDGQYDLCPACEVAAGRPARWSTLDIATTEAHPEPPTP